MVRFHLSHLTSACFPAFAYSTAYHPPRLLVSPHTCACPPAPPGLAGLQAAVTRPEEVRGVVLLDISLRGLHVSKQPAPFRPLIKARAWPL